MFITPPLAPNLSHIATFHTLTSNLFNPFNTELNPICHLLALLGTHYILHVSRIRVKTILILSSQLRIILQAFSFLHVFPPQPYRRFSTPPIHATFSAHLFLLHLTSRIVWWGVLITNLHSVQVSPVPCQLLPLRTNIFVSTVSLRSISPCSSLSVKDQVTHPYKIKRKGYSFVNVTLCFLSSRWSDKIFLKECWNDIT